MMMAMSAASAASGPGEEEDIEKPQHKVTISKSFYGYVWFIRYREEWKARMAKGKKRLIQTAMGLAGMVMLSLWGCVAGGEKIASPPAEIKNQFARSVILLSAAAAEGIEIRTITTTPRFDAEKRPTTSSWRIQALAHGGTRAAAEKAWIAFDDVLRSLPGCRGGVDSASWQAGERCYRLQCRLELSDPEGQWPVPGVSAAGSRRHWSARALEAVGRALPEGCFVCRVTLEEGTTELGKQPVPVIAMKITEAMARAVGREDPRAMADEFIGNMRASKVLADLMLTEDLPQRRVKIEADGFQVPEPAFIIFRCCLYRATEP